MQRRRSTKQNNNLIHFYHLTPRKFTEVPAFWKVFHLILYASIVVTGLLSGISFWAVSSNFSGCLLYGNLKLTDDNSSAHIPPANATLSTPLPTLFIDHRTTVWSKNYLCRYCEISSMGSSLIGIFMGVLLIISKTSAHNTIYQPTYILVFPSLVISAHASILTLASTYYMSYGILYFCKHLKANNAISCGHLHSIERMTDHYYDFTTFSSLAITSAYICTGCWAGQFFLLVVRLYLGVDFEVYSVTVQPKSNAKEEKELLTTDPNDTIV